MIMWSENEAVFLRKPYLQVPQGWSLKVKLNAITFTILGLALIEHLLAKFSGFDYFEREAKYCNYTVDNTILYYGIKDFPHYFKIFPHNTYFAVCFLVSRRR